MKKSVQVLSVVVVLVLIAGVVFLLTRSTTSNEAVADEAGATASSEVESEAAEPSNSVESTSFPVPGDWDFDTLVTQTGTPKQVALTFDDGPSEYTPQVLDILAEYDITATFCLLGVNVDGLPEIAKRVADEGHQLCNHSYNHFFETNEGPTQGIVDEMQMTNDAMKRATGVDDVNWYRAPWGVFTENVASAMEETNLMGLSWGADSQDWSQPGADRLAEIVLSTVRPESIILLHDGGGDRSQTVEALPIIIEELLDRGYTFTIPMEDARDTRPGDVDPDVVVPETIERR